ncbi:MAG: [protein-PII] uridylyltransferase, partial [Verrucomicrobiales bacterium]
MSSSTPTSPPTLSAPDLSAQSVGERLKSYKNFLHSEEERIRQLHLKGQGGLEVAEARCSMVDTLIRTICAVTDETHALKNRPTVIANGGYGRGTLNPGSDIDLLFLTSGPANKISSSEKQYLNDIQVVLWDLGFKLLPATRSVEECLAEAKSEPQSRTALFDCRLLHGDPALFEKLVESFRKECVKKDLDAFFEERRRDLSERRQKFSNTVYLQEPNVKDSPGGMRDFHNLLWITDAQRGTRDLDELVAQKLLTRNAADNMRAAFDFLHRVRNALHYRGKGNDILTLRLQGEIVEEFDYPQKSLLRKIEAFMRDYYQHTRAIYHHTRSVFEIFAIEQEDQADQGFLSRIPFLGKNKAPEVITLDDYLIQNGRMDARRSDIFKEEPDRLIRLFVYCQKHDARPSPKLRKLIKNHWHLIDRPFRYRKQNREAFREILERKGKAARTLRQMHRCGVLGRFLPEFGALDCLVQHEFFHRYTADEHTLRCIDQLDLLLSDDQPDHELYRQIFLKHPDPYALYLALILHDTGRAENVREHIDGSALLAARLCRRLQVTGGRRALITFLVDHHLTLWRFATKKNIEDPEVIEEFAGLMRDRHRLDALLLFTFADSNGTNEEAWSPWKESLILQLYRSTREYLVEGESKGLGQPAEELAEIRAELESSMDEKYHQLIDEQFTQMPKRYFRFRAKRSLTTHIRALWQFIDRRQRRPDTPFECAMQWIERPKFGYSELIIVSEDRPLLLEKICCALASRQISIHSADAYTRQDGIVLDILRVSTEQHEAVTNKSTQKAVLDSLYELNESDDYNSAKYLVKKQNYLHTETEQIVDFPTRAWISNEEDPNYTVIELQALDRIGLLHNIFQTLNQYGLVTVHARICTEKGAALDSIYVRQRDNGKLSDPAT